MQTFDVQTAMGIFPVVFRGQSRQPKGPYASVKTHIGGQLHTFWWSNLVSHSFHIEPPLCRHFQATHSSTACKLPPSHYIKIELGPSWVLVLRNALEISFEERPLALEMYLHGQDNCPETRLKNGSFSPQNGPTCGTTAWYMPYCAPICHHLIAQPPRNIDGSHCKRPGTLVIVPETAKRRPRLGVKSAVVMQRNLFVVMRNHSPVVSSYLDAGWHQPRLRWILLTFLHTAYT